MRYVRAIFATLTLILLTLAPVPASAAPCTFVLGFQTLATLIPANVGTCLVDEHHNPTNGDALQETTTNGTSTTGMLVWRKADNWTAFTDGFHTWINGPNGLQERLNTELFPWEPGYVAPPAPTPAPTPGPARYSRAQFLALSRGRTAAQFLAIVGPPNSTQQTGSTQYWYYNGITYDPITGRVDDMVQVVVVYGLRVYDMNFYGG